MGRNAVAGIAGLAALSGIALVLASTSRPVPPVVPQAASSQAIAPMQAGPIQVAQYWNPPPMWNAPGDVPNGWPPEQYDHKGQSPSLTATISAPGLNATVIVPRNAPKDQNFWKVVLTDGVTSWHIHIQQGPTWACEISARTNRTDGTRFYSAFPLSGTFPNLSGSGTADTGAAVSVTTH